MEKKKEKINRKIKKTQRERKKKKTNRNEKKRKRNKEKNETNTLFPINHAQLIKRGDSKRTRHYDLKLVEDPTLSWFV